MWISDLNLRRSWRPSELLWGARSLSADDTPLPLALDMVMEVELTLGGSFLQRKTQLLRFPNPGEILMVRIRVKIMLYLGNTLEEGRCKAKTNGKTSVEFNWNQWSPGSLPRTSLKYTSNWAALRMDSRKALVIIQKKEKQHNFHIKFFIWIKNLSKK